MHEGLIWVFHPNLRVPPSLIDRAQTVLPTHKSLCLVSSSHSDSLHFHLHHLFYMGAAEPARERTYAKTHISIHSCRAVRSNLDSYREWIVMQRGGRGGTNRMSESSRSSLPDLPLSSPRSPTRHSLCLSQVFFLSSHETKPSPFSSHRTGRRSFKAKRRFWGMSTLVRWCGREAVHLR